MKRKLAPILAGLLLTAGLVLWSGCASTGGPSLDRVETQTVEQENFQLTLPAAWTALEAEGEHVACAYQTADGRLQLQIMEEWGGMEYYSLDEVGDLLCQELSQALFAQDLAASLSAGEALSEQGNSQYYYCRTLSGQDAQGGELVCHVDVLAPYASVRYYLIYTADKESFEQNKQIIRDVLPTFAMGKTAEEIYQIIEEERTKAAEEAANQQEEIK